jgi:hypothetical protein
MHPPVQARIPIPTLAGRVESINQGVCTDYGRGGIPRSRRGRFPYARFARCAKAPSGLGRPAWLAGYPAALRACWMEWLDLVPLVAALATMALALTALTAGTELTRWLIDVALQTAVVLGFDAGTGRALTNYSEEL